MTGADEGHATGSPPALSIQTSYHTRTELWNSLTLTGNWGNRRLDIDGDGAFSGPEDRDEQSGSNVFSPANERTARSSAKTGGDHDDYATTYDAVGNLVQEDLDSVRGIVTGQSGRGCVYDAFGRLVKATDGYTGGVLDLCKYRYNGLGMRTMWQHDASGNGSLSNSERYYFMHDERWRVVATFRDQDAAPKESFVWHAAGQGGFGGSSYIDSVILRDRDNYTGGTPNPMTSASDGTLEERRFYCQNWRADVVAVTRADGTPMEYVRYSAYGEPTVYPIADLNMDGVVNSSDLTEWSNLIYANPSSAVYADSDLDFDGADDWASSNYDTSMFLDSYYENVGLSGKGLLSSAGIDNRIGYAGYQWDPAARAYHVRYRVYLPDIGRWTRRDPAGYVDQDNLYEYGMDSPVTGVDPSGLQFGGPLQLIRWLAPRLDPRSRYKPEYDSMTAGCGIVVKGEWFTVSQKGHRWIEMKVLDPATGIWITTSLGYWPGGSIGIIGMEKGEWRNKFWPASTPFPGNSACSLVPLADLHEGQAGDDAWAVGPDYTGLHLVSPGFRLPTWARLLGFNFDMGVLMLPRTVYRTAQTLSNCDQVRDCLLKYRPACKYDFLGQYNCRSYVDDALRHCGMQRRKQLY